jgi:serine/threonine protein kinase
MISEICRQFPQLTNIDPMRMSGGQKEVFRATLNGEGVALKLIKVYTSDQERAEREIAAVSKLCSDYVPKVYDSGKCRILGEERNYIIEQFIEGGTYRRILDSKPVQELNDVLCLADQLLKACSDFEAANLVHRDIKPGNLIIDVDGKLWIIDFGLVRHLDLPSLTPTGLFCGVGTPGYAAPEQFRNLKPQINIRADFFSIGVVLYEALTGYNPYYVPPANQLEIIRRVDQQNLPRLSISGDDGGFSDFLHALTQRFPSRRPQSAGEAIDWFVQIYRRLSS